MLFVVTSFTPSAEDRTEISEYYSEKFGKGKGAYVIPHAFQKGKYLTEMFSVNKLISASKTNIIVGVDLNVTSAFKAVNEIYGLELNVPTPGVGNYSHGHQRLEFEYGDPMWEAVKTFSCLDFKANKELDYQANPTPLMIHKGLAVVEIIGIVKAKDATRQDSYKIQVHLVEGELKCMNLAQAADAVKQECSFAKKLLSKYHN